MALTEEGVESLHAIQNGNRLVKLSSEQAIDCCGDGTNPRYQDYKCLALIGGLCTEEDYRSSEGRCISSCPAVGKVIGTGYVPQNREDLMVEVIQRTPLSAALDASQESFLTYKSGIYSNPHCNRTQLGHTVQIVGYGSTSFGQPYWIIKNSWGVTWGENGYMRIARGKNTCGIASNVFYPISDQQLIAADWD